MEGSDLTYVKAYQSTPNSWEHHCYPMEFMIHDVMLSPAPHIESDVPIYVLTDLQGIMIPKATLTVTENESEKASGQFHVIIDEKSSLLSRSERCLWEELMAQKTRVNSLPGTGP